MELLSTVSPLDQLLPDCKDHLFRFLTIQECLDYSSTSKTSLHDMLPNLRQRRQDQFLTNYCYQIEYPSILKPITSIQNERQSSAGASTTATPKPLLEEDAFCSRLIDKDHWHTIRSVYERIVCLYRAIPSSHPSNSDLRDLLLDLEQSDVYLKQSSPTNENRASTDVDFASSFKQFQMHTKAHRIHASILAQCTVRSKPISCDRYSSTKTAASSRSTSSDPTQLSVSLETYVGDVLCACYMMGHKISGVVEGGVSHLQWSRHILSLMQQKEQQDHAHSWYQYWIYLHSTLLRTFPLTPNQMETLLGSTCGIRGKSVPFDEDYIHPHYCYVGMEAQLVQETTEVVRTLLLHLGNTSDNRTLVSNTRMAHQTTMNRFGPLGPAFRGRDDIQTRIMNPFSLLHRLHHPSFAISTTWFLVEQKEHLILDSRTFHSWFSGTDTVMRWMLELKEECGKSRPMTVMPPIVTIEPVPLHAFMTDNVIQ